MLFLFLLKVRKHLTSKTLHVEVIQIENEISTSKVANIIKTLKNKITILNNVN